MKIGERIRAERRRMRMSQDEVAMALETTKQAIYKYEKGIVENIPPEKVEALANALQTTPAALMGWQGDDKGVPIPIAEKRLPVLGRIACGTPIYATSEYGSFCTPGNNIDADFCLCASGDSMIGARIFDGDIVFIRAQDTVENGEIAAVVIGDEATLKRVYFYPDKNKLVLSPENPKYEPLVYINEELNNVKILGKAVAYQSRIL